MANHSRVKFERPLFQNTIEQSYYNLFVAAVVGGVVGYLAFKAIRF